MSGEKILAVDRNRAIPLYYQVCESLEDMIKGGEIHPNEQMPSEDALAERFGVSRPTINKAIAILIRKSILSRERGRGTFVHSEEVRLTLMQELMSLHESMQRDNIRFRTVVLAIEKQRASAMVAEKLKLKDGARIFYLKRQRYVEEESFIISESYLPCELFPDLDRQNLRERSLYDVLEETFRIPVIKTERSARAVKALDTEAQLLRIPLGDPLIQLEGIAFSRRDLRVEYFKTFIRGDRGVLCTTLYRRERTGKGHTMNGKGVDMQPSTKGRILVTYELTPQTETIDRCADLLLDEMTSGIQYYSTRSGSVMDRVRDHVPFVDPSVFGEVVSVEGREGGAFIVTFSLPASNLDPGLGGITNLWPMVAGEVFNFYFIRKARLLDLQLPESFESRYLGPACGIDGIRKLAHAPRGPLFGAIIKPNLGLDPGRAAQVAAHLAAAGFDFVKDDEIMVNPDLCPMRERVGGIAQALDRASQATGRRMLYMANVTSDFATLERAASTAIEAGAGGLMIDPFCTGMSAIDYLRRQFGKPLYVHRVGYGLSCLSHDYSVSFEVYTRLFRLLGADFTHVGGIWGGSSDARPKVAKYLEILRDVGSGRHPPAWPVVSGISLESMREYYDFYGDDTLYLEHIEIYHGMESARDKLQALKACLPAVYAGGAR